MPTPNPMSKKHRQRPFVSMVFPCVDAVGIQVVGAGGQPNLVWETMAPLTVVQLSKGNKFPYVEKVLYLYAHLIDGYGEFNLRVEMSLVLVKLRSNLDDRIPGKRVLKWKGPSETISMSAENKLIPVDFPFECPELPFERAGVYEFQIVDEEGPLPGKKGILNVLDRRVRL